MSISYYSYCNIYVALMANRLLKIKKIYIMPCDYEFSQITFLHKIQTLNWIKRI